MPVQRTRAVRLEAPGLSCHQALCSSGALSELSALSLLQRELLEGLRSSRELGVGVGNSQC